MNGNGIPASPQQLTAAIPELGQISPFPFSVRTGVTETPDGTKVMIVLGTPMGPLHLFLDGDQARTMGQALIQAGRQAQSGLIVPNVVPPPDLT